MAAEYAWEWSNGTATYKQTKDEIGASTDVTLFKIKGFEAAEGKTIAETDFTDTNITVGTVTSGSATAITLKKGLLEKLKDGAKLEFDGDYWGNTDGYQLKVATGADGLSTTLKIGTSSVKVVAPTSDGAETNITGTFEAYAEEANGASITYHTEKTEQVLGTITGLKTTQSLSTAGSIGTDGKIKLKLADLYNGVTLEKASIPGLDSSSTIQPASFTLQLVDSAGTAKDLLGGVADNPASKWTTSGTTATYYTRTTAKWEENGDSALTYTAAQETPIVTISGFKVNPVAGTGDRAGKVLDADTTSGKELVATLDGSTFYIFEDALGTSDITLTKESGAASGTNYTLKLGKRNASDSSVIDVQASFGFSNADGTNKYWKVTGGTATLNYDVTQGWKVVGDKIKNTPAATETVIELTGVKATDKTTTAASSETYFNGLSSDGIQITTDATDSAAGVITLNEDAFKTDDNSTVTVTTDNYTLAVASKTSGTTLKTALTAKAVPNLGVSTVSGGTATIVGETEAWYEAGSSTDNKSYTFHTAKTGDDRVTFGTITGLKSGATKDDFTIDGTTIKLKDAALGSGTMTLKVNHSGLTTGGIAGVIDTDYKLDFDVTEAIKTAANIVKSGPDANNTLTFEAVAAVSPATEGTVTATVHGATYDWYELDSSNQHTITKNAGDSDVTLATITGLKADTDLSKISFKDGSDTATIVLGKDALGTEAINLNQQTIGGTNKHGLKLVFDESIVNADGTYAGKVGFGTTDNYWKLPDTQDGTATYQNHVEEGWTLTAGKNVTYTEAAEDKATVLLKIQGLKTSGLTDSNGKIDGIEVGENGTVTLDPSKVFPTTSADGLTSTSKVEIASGTGYTLALKDAVDNKVGFTPSAAYWRIDGTTAYLQYDTAAGWTYDDATKKIVYTAEKTGTEATVLATITGLKSGLTGTGHNSPGDTAQTNCYDSITGLTVGADGTIKIARSVLDDTLADDKTVALTNETGSNYTLAIDATNNKKSDGTTVDEDFKDITNSPATIGFAFTAADPSAVPPVTTASAQVKETRDAGWETSDNGTKLTYKTAVDENLANIDKLNANVVKREGDTGTITALYTKNAEGNYTEVVTLDAANKTIKLKNDALPTGNVALTSTDYTLTLVNDNGTEDADGKFGYDNEDAAKKYWHLDSSTKTTAYYTYDVGEGWTLATDGKGVTYKAAVGAPDNFDDADGNVLAKIENLASGLTDDEEINGTAADGSDAKIKVTTETNGSHTVTVDKTLLNTNAGTNVTVTAKNPSKGNYELAFTAADKNTDGTVGFDNADGATKYWTYSGGTATYRYDIAAGWKINSLGQIEYTAGKTVDVVTISGLTINSPQGTLIDGETTKYSALNGIVYDAANKTFKLSSDILSTVVSTTVKLTKLQSTDSNTYKLAFNGNTGTNSDGLTTYGFEQTAPAWSVKAGTTDTAQYKYNIGRGWTLNAAATEITYKAQQSDIVLAEISGLDSSNLEANLAANALTASSGIPTDTALGTITINNPNVLKTNANDGAAVTLTDGYYKLVYDGAVGDKDDMAETTALNFDDAASGTVTVKTTLQGGWYNSGTDSDQTNGKQLVYKANVNSTLATITGLKQGVGNGDITLSGTTITVAEDALDKQDATLTTSNGYTLALKDAKTINAKDDAATPGAISGKQGFGFENADGAKKYWTVDGTTATYQHDVGEGWYLAGTSIVYVKPRKIADENDASGSVAAPLVDAAIINLKSGLEATGNPAKIDGITVGADGKTITVDTKVLGTGFDDGNDNDNSAQLTAASTGYSLVLGGDTGTGIDVTAGDSKVGFKDGSPYWKITDDGSGGNLTANYMYDTAEGWTINAGKISYTDAVPKTILTITGLKGLESLTRGTNLGATLAGVTVGADGTVTLNKSVLGTADITLADGTDKGSSPYSGTTYKLAISGADKDGKFGFTAQPNGWTFKSDGTEAYYGHETGEGWQLSDTNTGTNYNKITYTPATDAYDNDAHTATVLATVTNLVNVDESKISMGTDGTITIDTAALTHDSTIGKETTLTLGANVVAGTYKLAIKGDDDKDGKVGFVDGNKYWAKNGDAAKINDAIVAAGTISYQYDTTEGWTLKDNNTITYKAAKEKATATCVAQISGLKNDSTNTTVAIDVNGEVDGITVSDKGVITISSFDIFDQTKDGNATLTLGSGIATGAYKLALADTLDQAPKVDTEATGAGAVQIAPEITSNTATIKGTIKEYATISGNIINYKKASSNTLATVNGLSGSAKANDATPANNNVFYADGVITLNNAALDSTTTATLTVENIEGNLDFQLDLGDDVPDTANVIAETSGYPKVGTVSGGKATIIAKTGDYYVVDPVEKVSGKDTTTVSKVGGKNITIAEVTGLKSSATSSDVTYNAGTSGSAGTISISKAALGEGTIKLVNKKVNKASDDTTNYTSKLAFLSTDDNGTGDDAKASDGKYGFKDGTGYWTVKDGVATYKVDTAEGWTREDDNTITYTPATTTALATIRGLKGLKDATKATSITGITVNVGTADANGVVKTTFLLKEDVLGTNDVTVTKLVDDSTKAFALDFPDDDDDNTSNNKGELGFKGRTLGTNTITAESYWVVKDGTATYQYDIGEGWQYSDNSAASNKDKVVYVPATNVTRFTVNGLKGIANGIYTNDEMKTAGLTYTGADNASSNIKVKPSILGDSSITFVMGDDISWTPLGFEFDADPSELTNLAGGVKVFGDNKTKYSWTVDSKGVAKYVETRGAEWRYASVNSPANFDVIAYTPGEVEELLTITGLKKGVTAEQLFGVTVDLNGDGDISSDEESVGGLIEVSPPTTTGSPPVTTKGKITVHADALGTTSVKLTDGNSKYELELGDDVQNATVTDYWTISGTTGTLKESTTAGWTDTNDELTYKAATTKTLGTLTGLKKGLAATSTDGAPAAITGVAVSGKNIYVDDSALGTGTLKFSDSNYTLKYVGTVTKTASDAAKTGGQAGEPGVLVGGGTATYKLLKPAYYDDSTKGQIKYVASTATKVDKTDVIYATITGLSKTATTADVSFSGMTVNSLDATKVDTKGTVTLKKDALNKANVKLTVTNGIDKIALDSVSAPAVTKSSWTFNQKNGTATMKGDMSEGYKLSADKKSVTYAKLQTGATLLTVSGLPKDCICKNNTIYMSDGKTPAFEIGTYDGTTFTAASTGTFVKASEALLAKTPSKITLKGTGYEFAPLTSFDKTAITGVTGSGDGNYTADEYKNTYVYTSADTVIAGKPAEGNTAAVAAGVDVWRVSGTTATYKRIIPAHYEIKNGVLTYVKEADAKNSSKQAIVYATVKNLVKGLTVSGDGTAVVDASGATVLSINSTTATQIDIAKAALSGTTAATITDGSAAPTGGYKFKLDDYTETSDKPKENQLIWTISGTTATLKTGTTAGYTVADKSVQKVNAKATTAVAEIKNLKSGITVVDGAIVGLTVNGKEITIDSTVLPATGKVGAKVTLTNKGSDTYTLKEGDITAGEEAEFWSVSGTTVNVKDGTSNVWELDDKKSTLTITTAAKQDSTSKVTLTGLKKGLKLNAEGKIEGIDITGNTITLDSSVLGTTDVKLTKGDYTLALANSGDNAVSAHATANVWSVSGTKAILKEATIAGYTVSGKTIKYTKANAGKEVAKIEGLKSGLKAVAVDPNDPTKGTHIEGIAFGVSGATNDTDTNKIYLDASVLDTKDLKLTSSKYTMDISKDGTDDPQASIKDGGTVWTASGTTATLKTANTTGYLTDATGKKITYETGLKAGSTNLATISGLKKGIKVDAATGTIDGIITKDSNNQYTLTETKDSNNKITAVSGQLTLDSRVLGTTNVTATDGVTLALADSVTPSAAGNKYVVNRDGSVTVYSSYTPKGFATPAANATTLTYNKTASGGTDAIAKITGLKSGIKADASGQIEGITYNSTDKTFTLSEKVLGTSNVTISDTDTKGNVNAASTTYKLALEEDKTPASPSWSAIGTDGLMLSIDSGDGGYHKENDYNITYLPKGSTKVVINGLKGISSTTTFTIKGNVIQVPVANIGDNGVTISGGDYTLAVDGQTTTKTWTVSGTTASYVETFTADGWVSNGTSITKATKDTKRVLATITGLPEGFSGTITADTGDGITTFTLPAAAFQNNTANIQVTGANYKLAMTGSGTTTVSDISSGAWSLNGTTATYAKSGKTAGYTVANDGKSINYTSAVPDKTGAATITGLKSGLKLSDITSGLTVNDDGVITVKKDVLGDTNVALSGSGYKLQLDETAGNKVPTKAAEATSTNTWALSGTKLTITNTPENYYEINSTGTAITKKNAGKTTLATITGLKKDLALNSLGTLDGVTIDEANSKIRLSADVLGTTNVALTSTNYKLSMANDVREPSGGEYTWLAGGTTATLKQNISEGYTLNANEKGITYSKEALTAVAVLSGVKKGIKAVNGEVDGLSINDNKVITVSEEALGTSNVTLSNAAVEAGYKLALDTDSVMDADDVEVKTGTDSWTVSGTTATYKNIIPAYYELASDNKTIKYTAQKDNKTLATLTNVANFNEELFDGDKTITLETNNLTGVTAKNSASISSSEGIKFELDGEVSTPKVQSSAWTHSGTTATLKGILTQGYNLSSDGTKVTYEAEKKNQTFAVVSGTAVDADGKAVELTEGSIDNETKTVKLYGNDLDAKGVSVNGSFKFDFVAYSDASINGSSGSESIAVDGSGLTVAAGAGNDIIDLGTAGGNTVVYGGGNDVIANFTGTGTNKDQLKITGTVSKAVYEDGDVIISVGSNTITLQDYSADTINYRDNNGNSKSVTVSAADLLESDNFMGADSELGSIVSDTDKLGDLEDTKALTDSNVTTLTKQSSLITYGKK